MPLYHRTMQTFLLLRYGFVQLTCLVKETRTRMPSNVPSIPLTFITGTDSTHNQQLPQATSWSTPTTSMLLFLMGMNSANTTGLSLFNPVAMKQGMVDSIL